MIDDDEEDEGVTEEELDEDTQAKLDAIAHPEKYTIEPGEMKPEGAEEPPAEDDGKRWGY